MFEKVVLTLEMLDDRRHIGRASGWRKLSVLECSPLLSLCQPGVHCADDDDQLQNLITVTMIERWFLMCFFLSIPFQLLQIS